MTLLLDTHTILWLTEQVPKLGPAARQRCDGALAVDEVAVPTTVFFELAWGLRIERIKGPENVRARRNRLLSLGVREIGLSAEIAMVAVELDELHGDPFDRFIVATAVVEQAILLTADRAMLAWPGRLQRRDARR
ncbi:MAG: type II toxin-antitoxin system VapC family toxin [Alphaproteobacteria bacterium]|nr:type II toxin-antitoxin system VapC family toxin [Alphaproteobacteria bacterium]